MDAGGNCATGIHFRSDSFKLIFRSDYAIMYQYIMYSIVL